MTQEEFDALPGNPWQKVAALTAPKSTPAPAPAPKSKFGRPKIITPTRFKPGDTVGDWTLVNYVPGSASAHATWSCTCSCGKTGMPTASALALGRSRGCGHDRYAKSSKDYGRKVGRNKAK